MSFLVNSNPKVCTRCVMDTTAIDISFDDRGFCSYCSEFIARSQHIIFESNESKQNRLLSLVEEVKSVGRNKPYDCIVGVSGGVDSSWTLVEVKRLGLRPLAVHMDNGWNSELAQNNIGNLVQNLGVDLYTHVIDWEEYRGLMQAFFDADVIDVELLYDNAMHAVNFNLASKYGLKHLLAGSNQATEGMAMPSNWNWYKRDKKNITALAKRNGIKSFDSFPIIGTFDFIWFSLFKKIKWVSFLDFLPYNKAEALDQLEQNYGYKRYPFKHYESVFTRFYQGYILPLKFGVDKRKIHFSTLIISGQMTREQAVSGLNGIAYASQEELELDRRYFLKKMNWSEVNLEDYINRPGKSHADYPNEKEMRDQIVGKFENIIVSHKVF